MVEIRSSSSRAISFMLSILRKKILLDDQLDQHLQKIDEKCHARIELLVEQMKARVGITELIYV